LVNAAPALLLFYSPTLLLSYLSALPLSWVPTLLFDFLVKLARSDLLDHDPLEVLLTQLEIQSLFSLHLNSYIPRPTLYLINLIQISCTALHAL
jgi:hypothetical protein